MFQRLQKGLNLDFLDNKIAEEQENQRQQARGGSATRLPSGAAARRGNGRTASPGTKGKARAQGSTEKNGDLGPAARGPDPEEFVIGDDAATPAPADAMAPEKEPAPGASENPADRKPGIETDELPLETRRKLAKLETLTTRYQELLRNYRTAHAHVATIEPFEAALREHTPLTSIADPNALVEFLNQRSLQSEMVMNELKRVTAEQLALAKERDELKVKLNEAEKKAREAFDEAAGKSPQKQEAAGQAATMAAAKDTTGTANSDAKADPDAFFSYDEEVSHVASESAHDEEITQLKQENSEQKERIEALQEEKATLQQKLEAAHTDLDAINDKLRAQDEQTSSLKSDLASAKTELAAISKAHEESKTKEEHSATLLTQSQKEFQTLQTQLLKVQLDADQSNKELAKKAESAAEELKSVQADLAAKVTSEKRDSKRAETLQGLVATLKTRVKEAEDAKRTTESKSNDLQFEIQRLEAEISSSGNIISKLRGHEAETERLRQKLQEAENDRSTAQQLAESKRGHEMAVASLRSQLKRAEKDRDSAYQMIIDCGKCGEPDKEREETEAGGDDAAGQTADNAESSPVDGADGFTGADAKKKNKKRKSKAKKKAAGEETTAVVETASSGIPTLHDLIQDPTKGPEILLNGRLAENPLSSLLARMVETLKERSDVHEDDHAALLRHHEDLIEQHEQTIKNNSVLIRAQNEEIFSLKRNDEGSATSASTLAERDARIEKLVEQAAVLQAKLGGKDVDIDKLREKLKGEADLMQQIEDLKEEIDMLREGLIESGAKATDALHELGLAKQRREELERELATLQTEHGSQTRRLTEIGAEKEGLDAQLAALRTELETAKQSAVPTEELESLQAQIMKLSDEKEGLEKSRDACAKQIEELIAQNTARSSEMDGKHQTLSTQCDELRAKAASAEKDLAVANQLAQTRFKDLADLRELYNKALPELKKLREESAELKTVKSELDKTSGNLRRLEAKEKDLQSEIAEYRTQLSQKDSDMAALKERCKRSDERGRALEESHENARRDLERSESSRDEALETRERLQNELRKLEDDLKKSKVSLADLTKQAKGVSDEASRLRDELQLRSAQQASAQSHMDSLQDQTRELAVQMKEARERNESLDEELADAHRLLSERSREGETMRRLLANVEGRAESRIKEMRERMDLAIEERDQAEDKASTVARRKARELEDLRAKLHDAERDASRVSEAKSLADRRETEAQARQKDLELRAAQAQAELAEVRTAMAQLRDALDDGERQARALDKDKADLRRLLDERDVRLEKLQKSSKTMAEEFRALQAATKSRQGLGVPSSRPSLELPGRTASPALRSGAGSPPPLPAAANKDAGVDFVYLKTVLLQFLEQKEKKHQMQLVPVLGMLLHFDRQDEQKLTAVISAR